MIKRRPISDELRANVRKAYAEGMPRWQLAKRLHLSETTVHKIVADMPDPHHGRAQQLFASLSRKRPYVYKNPPDCYIEDD